jgi:hypothetical protein
VPALGRPVADAIERPLPFGDIAVGEHRHRRLEHGVVIPPTMATTTRRIRRMRNATDQRIWR